MMENSKKRMNDAEIQWWNDWEFAINFLKREIYDKF